MNKKSLILLIGAALIVSADLMYLYSHGGGGGGGGRGGGFGGGGHSFGGGGRSFGGGGRSFSGGGRSFSGGGARAGGASRGSMSRAGTSRAATSRPGAGSRGGAARAHGFGHGGYYGHGWNRGGFGYWGAGIGGWGIGLWGFGFYLPLTIAALYGISNAGGSGDTTVINNYSNIPTQEGYDTGEDNAPQVPQDAVFISPEMMNDPKVKAAMRAAQIKQAQSFIQQEEAEEATEEGSESCSINNTCSFS